MMTCAEVMMGSPTSGGPKPRKLRTSIDTSPDGLEFLMIAGAIGTFHPRVWHLSLKLFTSRGSMMRSSCTSTIMTSGGIRPKRSAPVGLDPQLAVIIFSHLTPIGVLCVSSCFSILLLAGCCWWCGRCRFRFEGVRWIPYYKLPHSKLQICSL